jgi:hypothetical protein
MDEIKLSHFEDEKTIKNKMSVMREYHLRATWVMEAHVTLYQ